MHLGELPPSSECRVASIALDRAHRLRLSEMGLRPGARVRVTQRAAFGGRVLAVGADRFAVDAATCARIEITEPGS